MPSRSVASAAVVPTISLPFSLEVYNFVGATHKTNYNDIPEPRVTRGDRIDTTDGF